VRARRSQALTCACVRSAERCPLLCTKSWACVWLCMGVHVQVSVFKAGVLSVCTRIAHEAELQFCLFPLRAWTQGLAGPPQLGTRRYKCPCCAHAALDAFGVQFSSYALWAPGCRSAPAAHTLLSTLLSFCVFPHACLVGTWLHSALS